MAARAQVKPDFDGPEDRQLADDIARVMHHRPLMSRLARVETAHGEAPALLPSRQRAWHPICLHRPPLRRRRRRFPPIRARSKR